MLNPIAQEVLHNVENTIRAAEDRVDGPDEDFVSLMDAIVALARRRRIIYTHILTVSQPPPDAE